MSTSTPLFASVDNVVFTIRARSLSVLLIKRKNNPFQGKRALPGGFVEPQETVEKAAARELMEETSLSDIYSEQLGVFSDPKRDPRARNISIAFLCLVDEQNLVPQAGDDASEVALFPIKKLPPLAFDHDKILKLGLQRLASKMTYTDIAKYLLPDEFTLSEMQHTYEVVLNQTIDVRNFRKRIDKLGIIQETGKSQTGVRFRPAKLYRFKKQELQTIR